MKSIIMLQVAILLSCAIMAGGESGEKPIITRESDQPVVPGYYVIPSYINKPYSPASYVEFNLPESSLVSLFTTDTLGIDTMWWYHQVSMEPGAYRTSGREIIESRARFSGQVDMHLYVESIYGKSTGFEIECKFEAKRRM